MLRWLEGVLLWLRRRWRRLLLLLWPRRRRLLIQPGELGLNLFAAERLLARRSLGILELQLELRLLQLELQLPRALLGLGWTFVYLYSRRLCPGLRRLLRWGWRRCARCSSRRECWTRSTGE